MALSKIKLDQDASVGQASSLKELEEVETEPAAEAESIQVAETVDAPANCEAASCDPVSCDVAIRNATICDAASCEVKTTEE